MGFVLVKKTRHECNCMARLAYLPRHEYSYVVLFILACFQFTYMQFKSQKTKSRPPFSTPLQHTLTFPQVGLTMKTVNQDNGEDLDETNEMIEVRRRPGDGGAGVDLKRQKIVQAAHQDVLSLNFSQIRNTQESIKAYGGLEGGDAKYELIVGEDIGDVLVTDEMMEEMLKKKKLKKEAKRLKDKEKKEKKKEKKEAKKEKKKEKKQAKKAAKRKE